LCRGPRVCYPRAPRMAMSFEQMAAFIRGQEMGRTAFIDSPWGRRLLCYADLTATGRYLRFVERWLEQVRPLYANSHTTASTTGRLMTRLREQAREVIARAVHAGSGDVVMFVGSGATAAINKLVGLLGLRISEPLEREHHLSRHIPPEKRPVVFVGPYEHHSNHLPWLESVADVVEVALDSQGRIDLADLEQRLLEHRHRPLKLGAFSAASNVTGILTDVSGLSRVLHRHGAYACFDFAACAPYAPIDMHPADPEARLDAVFISPHKMVGGAGGSGVLVANRALFRSRTPERPGGGTVDYVASFDAPEVDYSGRLDEREEGGTPAILGDLRASAGFLVRQMFGPEHILEHELEVSLRAAARLLRSPRIHILGSLTLARLAILSFNIEGLHHNLVSTLLDQLFGIQCRAGCSCAGPYGHRLLGIGEEKSRAYRSQIARGMNGVKPGWVRVCLPYYASAADIDYILSAIEFVAERGAAFVPSYELSWADGSWRHVGSMALPSGPFRDPVAVSADALLAAAESAAAGPELRPSPGALPELESLVWFNWQRAR